MKATYEVTFSSGGLERVGDTAFEKQLEKLAGKFKGKFSGGGYGMGERDYGYEFKTLQSARKFCAALGLRARPWRVKNRLIWQLTEEDTIILE